MRSVSRLLDGMNYKETGEIMGMSDLGVRTNLTHIERFSSLGYNIADQRKRDVTVLIVFTVFVNA